MSDYNGLRDNEPTLRELVRGLHNKMDDHMKKTDRLNNIIFGDKDAGQDGLVDKVKKHGQYIATDKKIKWVGVGLAATTGATFWENFKHFFIK